MKRSGFTMIELIFVIVILGILAAVAIPKLAATRDDAEIAARATQAQTAVSEIGAYATAMNYYDMNLSKMSVAIAAMEKAKQVTINTTNGSAAIKDVRSTGATACVTIEMGTKAWTGNAATDANLAPTAGTWATDWADEKVTKVLMVTHAANTNGGCVTIQKKVPAGYTTIKGRSAQF